MQDVMDKIYKYSLEEIMSDRFGSYSKYIIQDRAIPDVRDGLKPVQRRILFGMYKEKNTYDKPYRKSAKTVGAVMGNFHPHGDSSIYEAMVRMSQWWKQNTTYIDMHGNNGSMDGDSPAAMRYTEARLSKISNELLSKMKDKYKKEYPHKVITRAIDIAEKNLNIIDDLKVAIIKYDTKSKLISSDNPIVHYNNFDNKSVGYINGGLIIFFPISSEILCVIYDSKIYLELNQDNFIHCKNEYEVKFLNYFQILNAYNFIFFKDDNMTSNLVNEHKKNKIQRLLNFPKLKTDILGSDDSKIITFSAQYIYLKHTFSFAKLTQRAKMVPQNAIDWFPRNYDEKYFNGNFKSRKEIVPFLSHLKKKNELKNAVIWTNDEIEKFNKFVIDYWNNKL